jgi:hypothetical protein
MFTNAQYSISNANISVFIYWILQMESLVYEMGFKTPLTVYAFLLPKVNKR